MNHAHTLKGLMGAVALLTAVAACGEGEVDPGEWPRWRGPEGTGISRATSLPVSWTGESDNVRWRTEVPGWGNSSPIVSHGRVFVTTGVAEGDTVDRMVVALDLASGDIVWQTVVQTGERETLHPYNSYAAATPATDGKLIFAHFGQYLAALDRDGEVVWKREIDPIYVEYSRYGAGSSPIVYRDLVIVAQDRELVEKPEGWMAAWDKRTGEPVWRVAWTNSCCSYGTPILVERGGRDELIFAHTASVAGYDPATGERLWSYKLEMNQPVPSVVMEGDLLAVFGGGNQVRNGAVLRLSGAGKETTIESLWETNRIVPQTASPVLVDGTLFTVVDVGAIIAYDAASGNRYWMKRLPRGNYRVSMVAGDGKVYATSSEGVTSVIRASGQWELLAENHLGEGSNASPALIEGAILLRSKSAVFRIDSEASPAGEPAG